MTQIRYSATGCKVIAGRYVMPGEHFDECDDRDCPGCWVCVPKTEHGDPLTHCTARKHCTEHLPDGQQSCPRCIGLTRECLTDIERLTSLVPGQARERGVESEAAMLAGPAVDTIDGLEAYRHRQLGIAMGRIDGDVEFTGLHPLNVLGTWVQMLREDYDHPSRERLTVTSAVEYLGAQLDRLAQDEEQDFPLFGREVRRLRSHLEAVLHDERGAEKGAPCHMCPHPAPRLERHPVTADLTGASDYWRCPQCGGRWTEAEYRQRVGVTYLGAADRLTADQFQVAYRIKPATLRAWASKRDEAGPLVRKRGRDESGRCLYDVADALAMRDGTRRESGARDTA